MSDQEAVQPTEEAGTPAITTVNRVDGSNFVTSNLIVKTRQGTVTKVDEEGNALEVDQKAVQTILLGAIPFAFPTLDNVFEGMPAPDSFTVEIVEAIEASEGVEAFAGFEVVTPVYNNAQLQYLQDALRVAVENPIRAGKTIVRNDLGLVTDWTINKTMVDAWTPILEVTRGSGYSYMSEKSDATNLFKAWLSETKLKPAQQETLVKVFRSPETVANMSPSIKAALEKTVSIWKGLLGNDEENDQPLVEKFGRHINKIAEGLEADVMEDFDSFDA